MAILALLNGKKYDVKEDANAIDRNVDQNADFIEITLIKNKLSSNSKEEKARFMKAAIAYWY